MHVAPEPVPPPLLLPVSTHLHDACLTLSCCLLFAAVPLLATPASTPHTVIHSSITLSIVTLGMSTAL